MCVRLPQKARLSYGAGVRTANLREPVQREPVQREPVQREPVQRLPVKSMSNLPWRLVGWDDLTLDDNVAVSTFTTTQSV